MKEIAQDLPGALRHLLQQGEFGSQEELKAKLEEQGFEVNQSKISRLLRKLGAAKTTGSQGEVVYRLPKEPSPPSKQTELRELIIDVVRNEQLIIVYTSPGSASLIARIMDYQDEKLDILGTVAGDDTILVIPKSVKTIQQTQQAIKHILGIA